MRDVTVDLLKELFDYDKETGDLIWKVSKGGVTSGAVVGCITQYGYKQVRINKKSYLAHRIVFLLHKGYLPKTLDHINGDRVDNRIENLRPVTINQNQHNRKLNKNNTSGHKGVSWCKLTNKWKTSIKLEGKRINLGTFDNLEEAAEVVREAREELHGSYANHGDDND
jgi:hypothetical protein